MPRSTCTRTPSPSGATACSVRSTVCGSADFPPSRSSGPRSTARSGKSCCCCARSRVRTRSPSRRMHSCRWARTRRRARRHVATATAAAQPQPAAPASVTPPTAAAAAASRAALDVASTWQVFKLDDPRTTYELYGSGSAPLGRLFGAGRFDRAITMLLACAKEVLDSVPTPIRTAGPCVSVVLRAVAVPSQSYVLGARLRVGAATCARLGDAAPPDRRRPRWRVLGMRARSFGRHCVRTPDAWSAPH